MVGSVYVKAVALLLWMRMVVVCQKTVQKMGILPKIRPMISHRLDTFTFLSPQGFTVEGICGCGYKILQSPTLEHKQAVQAVKCTHEEHVIQVLERVWSQGGAKMG